MELIDVTGWQVPSLGNPEDLYDQNDYFEPSSAPALFLPPSLLVGLKRLASVPKAQRIREPCLVPSHLKKSEKYTAAAPSDASPSCACRGLVLPLLWLAASGDTGPSLTTVPTANFLVSFCFLKAVVLLFLTL